MLKPTSIEESSGNVFADLGLPKPDHVLAKAKLASKICDLIEEQGFTQQEAANKLGMGQPKVSALINGHLEGFSLDRLFRFLNPLDHDIEMVITPHLHPGKPAKHRGSINIVPTLLRCGLPQTDFLNLHQAANSVSPPPHTRVVDGA